MLRNESDIDTTMERFASLMVFLINHNEERDAFFKDPELYEKRIGVKLSAEDKLTLKQISLNSITKRKKFNEKLVLCSSSGY